MNPLDVVIRDELLSLSLTKNQLVKELGYSKNPTKGIRRLNHFIETGECKNKEFVEKLMRFLRILPTVLKNATDSVKQKLFEERKRLERENFKSHIEVKFDIVPRPLFILGLCPKLWKIKIPSDIRGLGYEEELEEVVRIYKNHWKEYNGHFFGRPTCAKFLGFRYFQTYEKSILFDNDGKIIQIDKVHVPETEAFVKIK